MSWKPRTPATQESKRRNRPTQAELEALGLTHEPGYKCAACGEPVKDHGDPDCVTALNNALKAPPAVELGSLGREEAQAFAETLYGIWEEVWAAQGGKRDVIKSWIDAMDRWGLLEEEEITDAQADVIVSEWQTRYDK